MYGLVGGNKQNKPMKRCAHDHPTFEFGEYKIDGGSILSPHVKDANIYIGFDRGMRFSKMRWPWTEGDELLYPIQDMGVPADLDNFTKLLDWTLENITAGKKVFCGCIGGHGRTGLFLTALVLRTEFEVDDALKFVREKYCKKAVESSEQIEWLKKNFGLKTNESPTKKVVPSSTSYGYNDYKTGKQLSFSLGGSKTYSSGSPDGCVHPIKSSKAIW